MTIWFTSDHHFGHANVIGFCNRPYASVDEMDADLIRRWNEVVAPDDRVYHLGDFTLGGYDVAKQYFHALHGHIAVLENEWHHDKRWLANAVIHDIASQYGSFQVSLLPPIEVLEFKEYSIDGRPKPVILCHYPIAEWDRKHYGAWHLHGHSHGNFKYPPGTLALDVGVDVHNYTPISLEQVALIMRQKESENASTQE